MSTETCVICERELTPETTGVCTFCGGVYHLSMRNDVQIEECGEVWINDVHLGLEFACRFCLEGGSEDDGEHVGLRGASEILRRSVEELEGWMAEGRLMPVSMEKPYRFRRSDVETLANFMRPSGGTSAQQA